MRMILRSMGLRAKFLIGAMGIMLALGTAIMIFASSVFHDRFENIIERRGISLARQFAEISTDLVLKEQYLQMELMFKDTLGSERDVRYIFFVRRDGKVLAHTFDDGFPVALRDVNTLRPGQSVSIKHIATDKGDIVDIASPILKGAAGTLHVGIAGESIEQGTSAIVREIIWVIALILIAGGIAVTAFTRKVTKPLLELEDAVTAMGKGDLDRRVRADMSDEIGQLGAAFNAMAEARKQAEDDREKLIADLRIALDNVKTLRGLIPICASCKKIRDDKGYWGQIETYIVEHSDAEFSHGICPECADKLYPEQRSRKREKTSS